ncbi:MAG: glycosyltransferase, partial [Bacteroidota bacterium]
VILQNPDDRALLKAAGVLPEGHAHLIRGSGVDVHRFVPQPEPEGPPLVVLASRMLWGKGIETFVRAAERVRKKMPLARFALVGPTDEGNPASVPAETLREWAASGAIEWWGFRDDMEEVLRQAHIVCLPSEYGEGVPRILIEGAAAGRPLVATDIPGCREIVRDGETGFLVRTGDPEALSTALLDLLRDRDLRQRLGAAARGLAARSFSARSVIADTFDVYRRLAPDIGVPQSVTPEAVS